MSAYIYLQFFIILHDKNRYEQQKNTRVSISLDPFSILKIPNSYFDTPRSLFQHYQHFHLLARGFDGLGACLLVLVTTSFPGASVVPPVFFSSRALLKITVNPSADEGLLTSQSPNFGKGFPFSVGADMNPLSIQVTPGEMKIKRGRENL